MPRERGWTEEELKGLGTVPGAAPWARKLPPAMGRMRELGFKNRLEAEYNIYLDLLERTGEVLWHRYEAITLKLGPDCRFTPDQLVMYPDGHLELHDTKGAKKIKAGRKAGQTTYYAEEDAKVKTRVAAGMFPIPVYFVFKDRATGEWVKEEF